jgi:hypothetical protein
VLLTAPACAAEGPAAVELLEQVDAVAKQLDNNGMGLDGSAARDDSDRFTGVYCLKVTPFQHYQTDLKGWRYPIVEKPGPGEYRYVRFAWKKTGGGGIMVQFCGEAADWESRWSHRYKAGASAAVYPALSINPKAPEEWTVVTRDLFTDFGAFTVTGIAFTPGDGAAGLFDHMYLGRTVQDLDKITNAALGKIRPTEALGQNQAERLWDDLRSRDAALYAPAVRMLAAPKANGVAFLGRKLQIRPGDDPRLQQMIADLDADDFDVREAATRELEKLGDAAAAALRQTQEETTSAEVRHRVGILLEKLTPPDGVLTADQLRILRATWALELSGTPKARKVLASLSKTKLEPPLAEEVRKALDRLKRRAAKEP